MKKISIILSSLLLFTFILVGSVNASEYPEYQPLEYPTLSEANVLYFVSTDSAGRTWFNAFASNGSLDGIKLWYNSSSGRVVAQNFATSSNITIYKYDYQYWNGSYIWGKQSSFTFNPNSQTDFNLGDTSTSLIDGNVNIYMSQDSDELFFPTAPSSPPTVEEMIAEETPKMAEKVIQTMMIILLCGVGCLALLISLPVLAKVFYRFH